MILLNIILVLLPFTLYLWVGYGRIYHYDTAFTKHWPDFREMKYPHGEPDISLMHKGIRRFGYLLAVYYLLLALAVTGYAVLFFV